MSQKEAKLFLL